MGRNKVLEDKPPPEWKCENCGKKFRRYWSWFRSGVVGCSTKCTWALKKKLPSVALFDLIAALQKAQETGSLGPGAIFRIDGKWWQVGADGKPFGIHISPEGEVFHVEHKEVF